ncbi:MAG: LysM peptidoglycan-binding domain-containing protein [Cytophagales bacterium]|nr:LysM peptidoglycan-binding domain-containing protein [Cytophagales bacterium]
MKIPFLKESSSSNLPLITLFVLLITLVGLVFVGYEHFLGPENTELAKAEKLELAEDEELMEPPVSIITDSTSTVSSIDSSQGKDSVQKAELALEVQKQEVQVQKIPEEKVTEPSGKAYSYAAEKGESLNGVAKRFGLTVDQLKSMNPSISDGFKGGAKVNVKIKAIHTVGPGDVLRVVAEKYKVSKKSIMDANHKSEDVTLRGEQLVIPVK